jgi:hypothetical protein
MARLTQKLRRAAQELLDRQHRKTHPIGRFDNAGRFYLDPIFPCCAGLRTPSRAFPYPQMSHGRTIIHVATEFGYTPAVLRAARTRIVTERSALQLQAEMGISQDDLTRTHLDAEALVEEVDE